MDIVEVAARTFGVTPESLLSRDRSMMLVHQRQATMAAIRVLCGWSYPRIAKMFDLTDHGTVMHACRMVEAGGVRGKYLGQILLNLPRDRVA